MHSSVVLQFIQIHLPQIHLDNNKKVVGVTYIRHGKTHYCHYVEARTEIILSAGVIDSPRLLLLSGIGPKDHLESIGVCQ